MWVNCPKAGWLKQGSKLVAVGRARSGSSGMADRSVSGAGATERGFWRYKNSKSGVRSLEFRRKVSVLQKPWKGRREEGKKAVSRCLSGTCQDLKFHSNLEYMGGPGMSSDFIF